jgi:hypothetical protein
MSIGEPSPETSASAAQPGARPRRALLTPLLFAGGGVALVALVVHRVGAAGLIEALRAAAPLLPLALALEGARIASEAMAALALFRGLAARPGDAPTWRALLRVHLMTYGVVAFAPAGRAAGEALRATLLAPTIGGARAAAVGTFSQGLGLLATGLVSLPCALAAWRAGTGALATTSLIQAAVLSALGVLLLVATRRREVGSLLRRFRRAEHAGEAYVEAMNALPLVPLAPLGLTVLGRAAQCAMLATLLFAVGARVDLGAAVSALGAMLVGTSAGDFVPGQLGATDGAFTLFHDALGATPAQAVGAALLAHLMQLAWTILSALAPLAALKRTSVARALTRTTVARVRPAAPRAAA